MTYKVLIIKAENGYCGGEYDVDDPPEIFIQEAHSYEAEKLFEVIGYFDLVNYFSDENKLSHNVKNALKQAGYYKRDELEKLNENIKFTDSFVCLNKYCYSSPPQSLKCITQIRLDEIAKGECHLYQEVSPESFLSEADLKEYKKKKKEFSARNKKAKAAAKKRAENKKKKELERAKKLLKEAGEL